LTRCTESNDKRHLPLKVKGHDPRGCEAASADARKHQGIADAAQCPSAAGM